MNKKVMDALEAVADEVQKEGVDVNGKVLVDEKNLAIVLGWALGQRIHLQFGEKVGLKVYEEDEEGFDPEDRQPSEGTIIGFSGENGVIVETEHYPTMLYRREDVTTL